MEDAPLASPTGSVVAMEAGTEAGRVDSGRAVLIPLSGNRCQYGVLGINCNAPAPTKRQRPSGRGTWDVCDWHAAILDRIRQSITENRPLLDKLAEFD